MVRGRKRLPEGCENSQEEAELEAIADAMDAYDTMLSPQNFRNLRPSWRGRS